MRVFTWTTDWTWDNELDDDFEVDRLEENGEQADLPKGTELVLKAEADAEILRLAARVEELEGASAGLPSTWPGKNGAELRIDGNEISYRHGIEEPSTKARTSRTIMYVDELAVRNLLFAAKRERERCAELAYECFHEVSDWRDFDSRALKYIGYLIDEIKEGKRLSPNAVPSLIANIYDTVERRERERCVDLLRAALVKNAADPLVTAVLVDALGDIEHRSPVDV